MMVREAEGGLGGWPCINYINGDDGNTESMNDKLGWI